MALGEVLGMDDPGQLWRAAAIQSIDEPKREAFEFHIRQEFAEERDEYQSRIEELQDRLAEMTEQRDRALARMVSLEDQVGTTSAVKDRRHWEALSATLATLDMVTEAFDERRQGQQYIHQLLLHLVTIQKHDPKRLPLVAELVMGAVSTVAASER